MKYIEDTGVVKSVGNGRALIRLDHRSTEECSNCCACSAFAGGLPEIEVQQDGLEGGQRVRVRIPRPNPYLSILFVFILPVAMFIGGVALSQMFLNNSRIGAAAVGGGIIGLLLALAIAWLANHKLGAVEKPTAEPIVDSDGNAEGE